MPRKPARFKVQYPKMPRQRIARPQRMPQAMKAGMNVIEGGSTLILGVGALGLAAGVTRSLLPP